MNQKQSPQFADSVFGVGVHNVSNLDTRIENKNKQNPGTR